MIIMVNGIMVDTGYLSSIRGVSSCTLPSCYKECIEVILLTGRDHRLPFLCPLPHQAIV